MSRPVSRTAPERMSSRTTTPPRTIRSVPLWCARTTSPLNSRAACDAGGADAAHARTRDAARRRRRGVRRWGGGAPAPSGGGGGGGGGAGVGRTAEKPHPPGRGGTRVGEHKRSEDRTEMVIKE